MILRGAKIAREKQFTLLKQKYPLTIGKLFLHDSKRCQKPAKKKGLNFSDVFLKMLHGFHVKKLNKIWEILKQMSSPMRKCNRFFQVLPDKRLGPIWGMFGLVRTYFG